MMLHTRELLVALVTILLSEVYSQEPCQGVNCSQGQECRLIVTACTGSQCTLTPTCVGHRLPINECRYGKPILNSKKDVMVCDRDSDCPTQATCNTDTMDTSSTCCWTPTNARARNIVTTNKEDPCSTRDCPNGQVCRLQQAFCITTPCSPLPVCIESGKVPTSSASCPTGHPVLGIKQSQLLTCTADSNCPDSTGCHNGVCCLKTARTTNIATTNKEDPCSTRDCPNGQVCRLQQAFCIITPCPPLPVCIENVKVPTSSASCPTGHPVLGIKQSQLLTCTADSNCPDSTGCHNGVCCLKTDIQSVTVVTKPGNCPPPSLGRVDICKGQCSSDTSCPGNKKCCSIECGQTCVDPFSTPVIKPEIKPITKPGVCPPLDPGQVGTCISECSGDSACTGNQKCCSNGCGQTCIDPFSTPAIKPVITPVTKPGTCPPVRQGQFGICVHRCSGDNGCNGDKKCCNNGCGNECMTPYKKPVTKPGICPPLTQGQFGICMNQCYDDSACNGDMKCCSNGCGNACMAPYTVTPERPGSCPGDFYWSASFCSWFAPPCRQDSNCRDGMKCCLSNTCGRKACLVARKNALCDLFSRFLGLC